MHDRLDRPTYIRTSIGNHTFAQSCHRAHQTRLSTRLASSIGCLAPRNSGRKAPQVRGMREYALRTAHGAGAEACIIPSYRSAAAVSLTSTRARNPTRSAAVHGRYAVLLRLGGRFAGKHS